jgi:hypothetical protein
MMDGIELAPKRASTHFGRHNDLPPLIDPPLREPPPKPVFSASAPLSHPLPTSQAVFRTCQWLEGEPSELNWCGKPVAWRGCAWCAEHENIVWPNGRPRFRVH